MSILQIPKLNIIPRKLYSYSDIILHIYTYLTFFRIYIPCKNVNKVYVRR